MRLLCPLSRLSATDASENLFWNIGDKPIAFKMMVIKSVCNSWVTSSRYHESVLLPCIFGCNSNCPRPKDDHAADDVHHYIRCPALWSVIGSVMQTSNPPLPEQRLCLTALADPRGIVLAHGIYHAIKRGKRRWLVNKLTRRRFDCILLHAHSVGLALNSS